MSRERLIIIILSIILILLVSNYLIRYIPHNTIPISSSRVEFPEPPSQSNEELYKDIFISLLHPYIEDSLKNYYGGPMIYDPWHVKIINITRPNGYRTFLFKVVLQVTPYTGPHIQIGEDLIYFTIESNGNVTVDKHEHLITYDYLEQRRKEIQERLKDKQ